VERRSLQERVPPRSILADFPGAVIVLEGHCDERGSAEYNLGLGDRRSSAATKYLEALGITATSQPSSRCGRRWGCVGIGARVPSCFYAGTRHSVSSIVCGENSSSARAEFMIPAAYWLACACAVAG
jgi:OmpA family